MSLEHLEERCLKYLEQAEIPLVPVATLLDVCKREEDGAGCTNEMLMGFLSNHELIQIMPGVAEADAIGTGDFAQAGFDMGPRAILKARMPNQSEMLVLLAQQVQAMQEVLGRTMKELEGSGDTARMAPLQSALHRASELEERLKQIQKAGEEAE
jgi:hypothetical protein